MGEIYTLSTLETMLIPNIDCVYPARKKEEAGFGSVPGFILVHLHDNGTLKREQTAYAQKECIIKATVFRIPQRITIILQVKCTSCLILNYIA